MLNFKFNIINVIYIIKILCRTNYLDWIKSCSLWNIYNGNLNKWAEFKLRQIESASCLILKSFNTDWKEFVLLIKFIRSNWVQIQIVLNALSERSDFGTFNLNIKIPMSIGLTLVWLFWLFCFLSEMIRDIIYCESRNQIIRRFDTCVFCLWDTSYIHIIQVLIWMDKSVLL